MWPRLKEYILDHDPAAKEQTYNIMCNYFKANIVEAHYYVHGLSVIIEFPRSTSKLILHVLVRRLLLNQWKLPKLVQN
jgi:hypothetical protein